MGKTLVFCRVLMAVLLEANSRVRKVRKKTIDSKFVHHEFHQFVEVREPVRQSVGAERVRMDNEPLLVSAGCQSGVFFRSVAPADPE